MAKRITDLEAAATLSGGELVEVSQLSTTVKITATTISAQASDNSFNDSAAGFVAAGFAVNDRVGVIGFSGSAVNNIQVGVVTALTAAKMTIGGADGDVIVDDAAGESVTIAKWVTRRSKMSDISAAAGLPPGGADGQVLTKQSAADGDADWETPTGGGGGGLPWYFDPPLLSEYPTSLTGGASTIGGADDPELGLALDGGVYLAGDVCRALVRTITTPAADWSFAMKADVTLINANFSSAGIFIQDSATSRLVLWRVANTGFLINKLRQTNLTTYNGDTNYGFHGIAPFLRIRKVGLSLYYDISNDGKHWVNIVNELLSAFIANPDRIGFGFASNRSDAGNHLYMNVPFVEITGGI